MKAWHFNGVCRRILWTLISGLAISVPAAVPAETILRGQLADPVSLNIGLVCQWQQTCISNHKSAMRKALKYVAKYRPAQWRIEQCNRNAQRGRQRVDWIGYNNCIRKADLRYAPPPKAKPRKAGRRR